MKTNFTRGRSECHPVSEAVNSLDGQRGMVNKRQVSGSVSRFIRLAAWAIRPQIKRGRHMKALIAIALLALSSIASAHDIVATWQHATTRTDGTPITGTRSYSLRLYRGTELVSSANPTGTGHEFTGLTEGAYTLRIATIEGSRQGPDSDPVAVEIPFPPSAPTGLNPVVRIRVDITVER
jgi:hypothetical protein